MTCQGSTLDPLLLGEGDQARRGVGGDVAVWTRQEPDHGGVFSFPPTSKRTPLFVPSRRLPFSAIFSTN